MKILTLNLLFILCSFSTGLMAQSDFRPGYVITNKNDTLHGLIDYRGETRNSRVCNFRANKDSEVREFLPADIHGYRFENSKYYVSKVVPLNHVPTPLFLEFLVNGIADLFYFKDGTISHFFISKSDGVLTELNNEEIEIKKDGKTYLKQSKQYIGLLKYTFADCPQLSSNIDDLALGTKSLINITKKYHNYVCDDQKCIIYEKQLPAVKVVFAPFLSMNGSFLSFENAGRSYKDMKFQLANYPSAGILMNTSLPRANEKLSFVLSGEVSKNYFYGKSDYYNFFEEVHIHTTVLTGKSGIKYTYPTGKFRPIIMVGANLSSLLSKDAKRMEDRIENGTVTSNVYGEDLLGSIYYGYNVDFGFNYRLSQKNLAFMSLGFTSSTAKNSDQQNSLYFDNPKNPLTSTFNTINLCAGFYF